MTKFSTLKPVVVSNINYIRKLAVFSSLLIVFMPVLQRFLGISGARSGWSLTQLWYSIRDDYFFNDPMLYLIQGEYTADPVKLSTLGFSILATIVVVYLVVSLAAMILNLLRQAKNKDLLSASIKQTYFNFTFIKDDVILSSDLNKNYSTWEIDENGRKFIFALSGDNVIISTKLSVDLPHIVIDSKKFIQPKHQTIDPKSEYVIDGVMFEYFNVYSAENSQTKILQIFNPLLCDYLIRYAGYLDFQIRGNQVVMYTDIKSLKSNLENDKFAEGIAMLLDQLELSAPKAVSTSALKQTNNKLIDSILLKSMHPVKRITSMAIVLIVVWMAALSIRGFDESSLIGLLTLLGIITVVVAHHHKRSLV